MEDYIRARNITPTDALGFHETSTGDKLLSEFDSYDARQTADGMLGRLFYSFDDRYMFTGSVRRDGYSAFGTSNPAPLSCLLHWPGPSPMKSFLNGIH
ncbi:hypothetical protein LWM68_03440 [Niabella sp. W65]|nr:hypothetical protein [Niabella sp. W65]MCH7361915.1 hypothetical protein [Niabella sp. W65]